MKSPYKIAVEKLESLYNTNFVTGLSTQEVERRVRAHGKNVLPETKQKSWMVIFLEQFKNPLIYILLVAAFIIFLVGNGVYDAFIITAVLLFNAIIGTIQEGRAQNILATLKKFLKSTSLVIRNGKKELVDDSDLVVGDIIELQEGWRVPADARLIEVNMIRVDESMLTGESEPIVKHANALTVDVSPADQKNMIFRGAYVLTGMAKAVVTAIGTDTYIGSIHSIIEDIAVVTPLKKELERLSYWILFFALFACVVLLGIGIITGKPMQELLVMLTALFICVVPEGLPVVLSLILITGVYRMAKKNILVKNMQRVEILGRTDVIIIDKTGTITRNEMMVSQVCTRTDRWRVSGVGYSSSGHVKANGERNMGQESLEILAVACNLLNNAEIIFDDASSRFTIKGDPVEAALYVFSQKVIRNTDEMRQQYEHVYEIPFSSDLKYHAVFFKYDSTVTAFIAGAPEIIFGRCIGDRASFDDCLNQFLDEGLRTIAVAMKKFDMSVLRGQSDDAYFKELVSKDLSFLGVCGLEDTIRPHAPEMIAQARAAGISVVMATGDHEKTARIIAQKAGIYRSGDTVIDGVELAQLSDSAAVSLLEKVTVFARVSSAQKLRIINLYHKKDLLVAMTGDGVNDAPSLVAADLGIAMGKIGTEVAKKSADLVLLDDSFGSIVSGIEQGRHIFYTLKKVILYFFSTNAGEVLIVMFALLSGLPLPITAAQILWLNLVTDGFLDVALAHEPQRDDLLDTQWCIKNGNLIDVALVGKMIYAAVPMAIGSLVIFYQYYENDLVLARTLLVITLAMFQWFNAWNCRSEKTSFFKMGFFANKWLVIATVFVLFLQICLVYVPFMQALFKTVPLTRGQWMLATITASSIIFFEEVRKFLVRSVYGG